MLVVFSTLVCVIEGWSLCAAVAHAVETRDRSPLDDEEEEEREEGAAPVISYQKWRLGDQGKTADAALLGIYTLHIHFFSPFIVSYIYTCVYSVCRYWYCSYVHSQC